MFTCTRRCGCEKWILWFATARAETLVKLAESNAFPAPRYMEIHTGAEDNGCDPLLAKRFASLIGNTKLHIVTGAGHQLGAGCLQDILRKFLGEDSAP